MVWKNFCRLLKLKKTIIYIHYWWTFWCHLYILAFNFFPAFHDLVNISKALGASAAVIAVVVTISFYVPEYRMNLLFIAK
jgi:hypothetical protein